MVSAIILAAGRGIRMNNDIRKQYLLLAGRPILAHTLLVFDDCPFIDKIFLVIPKEDIEFCHKKILCRLKLQKKVNLVFGGAERQDSVYNGLIAADNAIKGGIVVIHDAVRPFVSQENIVRCITCAKESGACILGIPVPDTIKTVNSSGYIENTIKRDTIWLAQTPQVFQYELIRQAYEYARRKGYAVTDDASLVECIGEKVKVICGSRYNIKITTQEDLLLANAIFQQIV